MGGVFLIVSRIRRHPNQDAIIGRTLSPRYPQPWSTTNLEFLILMHEKRARVCVCVKNINAKLGHRRCAAVVAIRRPRRSYRPIVRNKRVRQMFIVHKTSDLIAFMYEYTTYILL